MPYAKSEQLQKILEQVLSTNPPERSRFLPQFFAYLINCGDYLSQLDRELGGVNESLKKTGQVDEVEKNKLKDKRKLLEESIKAEQGQINGAITYLLNNIYKHIADKARVVDFLERYKSIAQWFVDDVSTRMGSHDAVATKHFSFGTHLLRMLNSMLEVDSVQQSVLQQLDGLNQRILQPALLAYHKPKHDIELSSAINDITAELAKHHKVASKKLVHLLVNFGFQLRQLSERLGGGIGVLKKSLVGSQIDAAKEDILQLPADSIRVVQMLAAVLKTELKAGPSAKQPSEEYKALDYAVAVYCGFMDARVDAQIQEGAPSFATNFSRSLAIIDKFKQASSELAANLQQLQNEAKNLPKDSAEQQIVLHTVNSLKDAADDYCEKAQSKPTQALKNAKDFHLFCERIMKHSDEALQDFKAKKTWSCIAVLCTAGAALAIPPVRKWFFRLFKPAKNPVAKLHIGEKLKSVREAERAISRLQ